MAHETRARVDAPRREGTGLRGGYVLSFDLAALGDDGGVAAVPPVLPPSDAAPAPVVPLLLDPSVFSAEPASDLAFLSFWA